MMALRTLTLVLTVQLLLTQLLTCHRHAEGRDATPHIHLSAFGFGDPAPDEEHDADAVYLPDIDLTNTGPRPVADLHLDLGPIVAVVLPPEPIAPQPVWLDASPPSGHPPGPPLYLRNASLLI
jgi:hypothetical protein